MRQRLVMISCAAMVVGGLVLFRAHSAQQSASAAPRSAVRDRVDADIYPGLRAHRPGLVLAQFQPASRPKDDDDDADDDDDGNTMIFGLPGQAEALKAQAEALKGQFEGLKGQFEGLKDLEGLKGLEKLKELEGLKFLSDTGGVSIFVDRGHRSASAKLRRKVEEIKSQLHDADEKKKAELTKQLEGAVSECFDEDMKVREKELTRIEERLAKLRSQLDRRRKARGDIIQLELKVLLNEAEGLGFSVLSGEEHSGFGAGMGMGMGGGMKGHKRPKVITHRHSTTHGTPAVPAVPATPATPATPAPPAPPTVKPTSV
jgi:hypothetical protein